MDFLERIQAEAEKLGIELTRGREKGEWVVVSNSDGIHICSPAHSSYPRGQTQPFNEASPGVAPQSKATKPKRESPYLMAQEAADYLGITIRSLYGQIERRRLIPLRGPRRTYRFTTEMLDDYLARN